MKNKFTLAVHGGAGTITRAIMTTEKEAAYYAVLKQALKAGTDHLKGGSSAMDAVISAIMVLEDSPLFNAGCGSVFTHEGKHEMDAAVMRGDTLAAGAVAGVNNIRNPIVLARSVMEKSDHVLLAGHGAETFATINGIATAPGNYFYTEARYQQLQAALKDGGTYLDHNLPDHEKKFGTVGAVALDMHGNLAAGTSTGGMTNKKYNRIGDSPLIGAGTYANNETCAVSCTGHGEYFIRSVVAYDISCLMEYKGLTLQEACDYVVKDKLVKRGGEGGLIAVDSNGDVALPFNSEGMYRGFTKEDEIFNVMIYN